MGNRKKSKVEKRKVFLRGDLGLTAGERQALGMPMKDPVQVEAQGIAMAINAPLADKVVFAEKPAVIFRVEGDQSTKTVIGTTLIYEDGTVDVTLNDDIPQWAKDRINATAGEFGYTIGAKLDG